MHEVPDLQEKQSSEGGFSFLLFGGRIDETKDMLEVEGVNRKF